MTTARAPGAALRVSSVTGAGLAVFVGLAWTASSGPHLFDAGEIVAAAAQLGASHPPGQPLHAVVAHAALLVPLGPLAWRIACVSALFGVLAAIAGARIVLDATQAPAGTRGLDDERGALIPALAAIVAIPLAPAIAPQLGRPEVYTLALFLTLEGTRRLLAWARGEAAGLRVGALCAGLAVAVHPPHALALLAMGAALLLTTRREVIARPRALAWAALACVLGMLVIVYLPLRGAAGAPMWGDPTSLAGLWDYLSASAYRRNLGTEDGSALGNAIEVVGYVLVPGGLGALLALVAVRRPEQRAPIVALAVVAATAIVAACLQRLEPGNPDNVAYAGPAAALFVALGLASAGALRSAGNARTTAPTVLAPPALATAALLALALVSADLGALRQAAPQLETLAFLAVDAPPPRALVIARTDFVAAAWMEARSVEGARPDVAFFVQGLATSSWHWRTLRDHPPFDGAPVRGTGPEPWVAGAVARAQGALPIVAEDDAPVGGRGVVLGPYLLLAASPHARVERSFAERTFGAPARMIPFTPAGHGGAAHGVVRDAEIARARRLFARDRAALAIAGLARAAAPLPPAALAPALGAEGSPMQRPPPVIHDPGAIYAGPEDAVRDLAAVLVSIGAVDRAIALLALQGERGDDRALLQLAWLHHTLGRDDAARAPLDAYRALHPDRSAELERLDAALGPAAPGRSP